MNFIQSGIMKTHKLFPTIVYEFNYHKNDMVKQIVREDCMNYVIDGKANETTNPFLHQNEKLIEFYFYISQCIRESIKQQHVDPNKVNVYITKSYFNVMNTPCGPHHHRDSDVSFVYYCNIPQDEAIQAIRFYSENKPEFSSGFCQTYGATDWDIDNSLSWGLEPTEGELLIFPASLSHGVGERNYNPTNTSSISNSNEFMQYRISIVGDVILTFSDSFHSESTHGNFAPDQWRMFSG